MSETVDTNADGIDDRWLDLAGDRRRQLLSNEQQCRDLDKQLKAVKERIATLQKEVAEIKAAITGKTAYVEPVKK